MSVWPQTPFEKEVRHLFNNMAHNVRPMTTIICSSIASTKKLSNMAAFHALACVIRRLLGDAAKHALLDCTRLLDAQQISQHNRIEQIKPESGSRVLFETICVFIG